jgi:hypothetical protein
MSALVVQIPSALIAVAATTGGNAVGVSVSGIVVAEGDSVGAGAGCFDPEQDATPSNKRLMINRKTIFFMIEPPFSLSRTAVLVGAGRR